MVTELGKHIQLSSERDSPSPTSLVATAENDRLPDNYATIFKVSVCGSLFLSQIFNLKHRPDLSTFFGRTSNMHRQEGHAVAGKRRDSAVNFIGMGQVHVHCADISHRGHSMS